MRNSFVTFLTDKRGSTAIEYAMLAGMVALAIVAGVTQIGTTLSATYLGALITAWTH